MTKLPLIEESISSSGHSPMYVMHKFFGRKQGSVIREYIKNHTENKDAIVLDPFCGSSTTGVAAISLNRNYFGIDMEEEYLNLSKKRLVEAGKKHPLLKQ